MYAATYNPEVTLETDEVQQIVWISGVNAPCNAFEIVRIFRFGDLDKSVKEETATKRRPSYKAMLQLCAEDTTVKLTVIKDKNKSVNVNSDEWEAVLSLNDRNQIERTGQNIKLILLNDPQLKKVRFDRFTKQDITDCPDFCNERDNRIDDESIGKIAIISRMYTGCSSLSRVFSKCSKRHQRSVASIPCMNLYRVRHGIMWSASIQL